MGMQTRYAPPVVQFDTRLANELARWEADQFAGPGAPGTMAFPEDWPNPFKGYSRSLTDRGGLLFTYRDQAVSEVLTLLRVFTWPIIGDKLIAADNGVMCADLGYKFRTWLPVKLKHVVSE